MKGIFKITDYQTPIKIPEDRQNQILQVQAYFLPRNHNAQRRRTRMATTDTIRALPQKGSGQNVAEDRSTPKKSSASESGHGKNGKKKPLRDKAAA